MLGQAWKRGILNPEKGHAAEAALPVFQSPLDQFGASQNFEEMLVVPLAFTRVGMGIPASDARKQSDALMNVSNKPSEINVAPMPTIIVSSQMPRNQTSAQNRRLPLHMVSPRLAWSPS